MIRLAIPAYHIVEKRLPGNGEKCLSVIRRDRKR